MGETILFFDDKKLHYKDNVERKMGTPEYVPQATLLDERVTTWPGVTVWRDNSEKIWKALYVGTAYHSTNESVISFYPPSDTWDDFQDFWIDNTTVLLYAESPDGIQWTKPDLTSETDVITRVAKNQVFGGGIPIDETSEGGPQIVGEQVFIDKHESDPDRRLKWLYAYMDGEDWELRMATSSNGLEWGVDEDPLWDKDSHVGVFDGQKPIFYHEDREKYVVNHRVGFGDRRVFFSETTDFNEFSGPDLAIAPATGDPDFAQTYSMPVFPYEGMYIGLLWRLIPTPHEVGHKYLGRVDCALTYSYSGDLFNRATHDSFIDPRSGHGGGVIWPSSIVTTDDQIRIYSTGTYGEHAHNAQSSVSAESRKAQFQRKDPGILLHTLRKDGYFFLEPPAHRGEIITCPLRFKNDDLRINVNAPYGKARFQVLNTAGETLDGFSYHDSEAFSGDKIEHEPRWKNNSLNSILGESVMLGIELTEAKLYAIRGGFSSYPISPEKILGRGGH